VINISIRASGVFAARTAKAAPLINQASASSIRMAMHEWATGRGRTATELGDRFTATAFSAYGFTRRTPKYRKAQRRAFGSERPYRSPRTVNISAALAAGLRGNGQALIAAAARIMRAEHMERLVQRPGGFLIKTRTGSRRASVAIRFPGARALNIGGAKNAIYRKEFPDLSMGGGRDARAIMDRAQEIFRTEFKKQFDSIPMTRLA
jgi:hypothetical protein